MNRAFIWYHFHQDRFSISAVMNQIGRSVCNLYVKIYLLQVCHSLSRRSVITTETSACYIMTPEARNDLVAKSQKGLRNLWHTNKYTIKAVQSSNHLQGIWIHKWNWIYQLIHLIVKNIEFFQHFLNIHQFSLIHHFYWWNHQWIHRWIHWI